VVLRPWLQAVSLGQERRFPEDQYTWQIFLRQKDMEVLSAESIFEESLWIDSSEHFLGLRLNMYIAIVMTLAGLAWFATCSTGPPGPSWSPRCPQQPRTSGPPPGKTAR
jgi:hypothetical protein